ncbi:MAG: adenylosuccinate synthetase [Nanoarchaeota archaeon]
MKGYSDVLVGVQYGDEGKARIIDSIASGYDVIARFNGGPNAGHTLEVGDKRIALHQVPSGIFYPDMQLYVGSGCVLNLQKLFAEIKEIESNGITLDGRFNISDQLTVIQPHHILLDRLIGGSIGTTANGIGPAYADQALRIDNHFLKNLRLGDILDDPSLALKVMVGNYKQLAGINDLSSEGIEKEVEDLLSKADALSGYICRNPLFLEELASKGKNVLFEGAQASMLDVTKGTVPYVTSSHTVAGFAYVGGDLSPGYHRKTIGVGKAIMSRVGNGPFISEFGGRVSELYCDAKDESGKTKHVKEFEQQNYSVDELLRSADLFKVGIGLRMLGNEYGATTKRPRRIGPLDLEALRGHCKINGVDELYLTKVDCLADFSKTSLPGIPVVVGYSIYEKEINHIPGTSAGCRKAKPIVDYLPHFSQDLSAVRDPAALPAEVQELIRYVEQYVGCKVAGIGVGPEREQFVRL